MEKPPRVEGAPGHRWQARADGRWVLLWVARRDIVKDGFAPKTHRVYPPTATPDAPFDEAAMVFIRSECTRLQDEMHAFARGGNEKRQPTDDGSMRALIRMYLTDPDSPFQNLRYRSKLTYETHCRAIEETVGDRQRAAVRGRDIIRWHANYSDEGNHLPRAHARMTMLRELFRFGATILEDPESKRLRAVMSEMEFPAIQARDSVITAEQAIAFRGVAHGQRKPSMALAQAFQFELLLRPKDVVGEWMPVSEPGMSAVLHNGKKWLFGIDWSEIDGELRLTHRLSKSVRGRTSVAQPRRGKIKRYELGLYPMVMEELRILAGIGPDVALTRAMLPASGPVIVCEGTGRPYNDGWYRKTWRELATAAGIPTTTQNRDSRAGGITEGIELSEGDVEAVRHAAGHAQLSTTLRYSRQADRQTENVARIRSKRDTNNLTNKE